MTFNPLTRSSIFLPGVVAAAVAVGFGITTMPLAVIAVVGATLLAVAPEVTFVVLLVGLEEQTVAGSSTESAGPLVRWGGDLLYWTEIGGLRIVTVFALATAASVLIRRRVPVPRMVAVDMAAAAGLAAVTVIVTLGEGLAPLAAVTWASPWVVLAAGIVVGRSVAHHPTVRRQVVAAGVVVLAVKAVISVYSFAAGHVLFDTAGILQIVWYDSALPSIAGAALIVLAIRSRGGFVPVDAAVAVACALIVVVAMRRNVVAALGVAAVIVLVSVWRPVVLKRLVVGSLVAAVTVTVAVPGAMTSLTDSMSQAWATMTGRDTEVSTQGHIDDIVIGWEQVSQSPWTGVGATSPPLPGVVTEGMSDRLYVHNQLLQDWLSLGVAGAGLSVLLVVVPAVVAVRTLRRNVDFVTSWAAVFALVTPVTLVWFPHLSTTFRWPLLFGFACGVLLYRRANSRPVARGDAEPVPVPVPVSVTGPASSPGISGEGSP